MGGEEGRGTREQEGRGKQFRHVGHHGLSRLGLEKPIFSRGQPIRGVGGEPPWWHNVFTGITEDGQQESRGGDWKWRTKWRRGVKKKGRQGTRQVTAGGHERPFWVRSCIPSTWTSRSRRLLVDARKNPWAPKVHEGTFAPAHPPSSLSSSFFFAATSTFAMKQQAGRTWDFTFLCGKKTGEMPVFFVVQRDNP